MTIAKKTILVGACLLAVACGDSNQTEETPAAAAGPRPAWNDINVIRENAEAPRAHFDSYPDRPSALSATSYNNPWTKSLNGNWKFAYSESPATRPRDFYQADFDASGWAETPVPSNWEREGYGYAIYVNVPYAFEIDEPNVPQDQNPVGSYRREFEVSPDWLERDVFVKFGAVSSAFYVWVNGEYVGYSEGSKTPSEFNVSEQLQAGINTIAVEVYRWSTGSYLEDQDFWSLSGIQRDVEIAARPRQRIQDFFVHAGLENDYRDGAFSIDVDLVNSGSLAVPVTLNLEILDGDRLMHTDSASVELQPGTRGHTFTASFPGINAWSAEYPNLYTMSLELQDTNGQAIEALSQGIGFRSVEIDNGRFMVNGKKVKLKGANLHEHHQETGHVVDEETMLRDIQLMKAANLNAVRNSHYPHQERWYELTSEYGLYMVDEANIESHGYGYDLDKTLGNKEHWMPHHLDRTKRMFERSKNYPSVVIWSLGNEAGDGVNLGATYKWIKSRDASRPVQYETEGNIIEVGERHSDFHSSMYWRHWDLEEYAQTHDDRPFVLIEYAHSMGNSTGNLTNYWDVINKHDVLAGGFIWDWVDQGLLEHNEDDVPYWTYGGDYGPENVPSSGNFNFNGVVFPDRRVQPAYWEVKRVYQYVDFEPVNLANGQLRVTNNYNFTNLQDFELQWDVTSDGRVVQSGTLASPDIAPESDALVQLQYSTRQLAMGPEHFLNLRLVTAEQRGLLPEGHIMAEAQLPLHSDVAPYSPGAAGGKSLVTGGDSDITVSNGDTSFLVDTSTGLLTSVIHQGQEMLLAPLAPNFWRAPTDNDFGNYMPEWAAAWEQAGRNRILLGTPESRPSGDYVEVVSSFAFSDDAGERVATWQMIYTILPNGAIEIANHVQKADGLPVIPRVGLNTELPRHFDQVEWFGRGPFENYVDRKLAANVGRYSNTVADHYVPYMRPQENGYKTDVRWLSLSDGQGTGLLVTSDDLISFSAHHNRQQDFVPPVKIAITSEDGPGARDNAERVNIHVSDIKPRDLVSLNIDFGQMGVGGDDSWGKRTLQEYSLNESAYTYSFRLTPYQTGGGQLDQLVDRTR